MKGQGGAVADDGSGLSYLEGRKQGASREQVQNHELDIPLSHKMSRQSAIRLFSAPAPDQERSEVPGRSTFLRSHSDLGAERGAPKVWIIVPKDQPWRDPWVAQWFGACLWPRARP